MERTREDWVMEMKIRLTYLRALGRSDEEIGCDGLLNVFLKQLGGKLTKKEQNELGLL